ncbi:hypothetical protein GNI_128300 [Gregarina niphandrodes]|uniref:Uncharacterized protein n=1 Tax=Gregarina niphandrodes TaxID=110365 RepID=A0A023B1R4_GRENI|nr:hypothetical protein GNI_128300 [Gregarina niphandrodes]EZG48818.1 hypothetical protein GNI_128300 [Gregarina niphandrodes]|eukprot:XP_011132070.1 hypothetical protein GNI_128300 [Gregarina niphandrodes]
MFRRAFSLLAIFAEAGYYVKGTVPRGTFRSVPITLPVVGDPVVVRPRGTYKPLTVNPSLPPLSLDTWVPVEYYRPHGYIYVNQEDGNEYTFVDNATRPVVRRPVVPDRLVGPLEPREAREPEIFDFMDPIDPAFSQPIMDTIHQSPDIRLGSADSEEAPRRPNLRGMVDGLAALPVQLLKDAISIPQHFAELFRHGLSTDALADCNSLTNPLCISANVWATFATAARVDGSLDVFNLTSNAEERPFLAAVTEALADRLGEFRASQPVVGVVADAESEEVVAVYQPDCRVDKLVQIPGQVAERLLDAIDRGRQVIFKETENIAQSISRKDLVGVLVEPLDYLSKQIRQLANDRLPEEALEDTVATVNAGAEKLEIAITKVIDQLTAFPQAVIEKVKEAKEEVHQRVSDAIHHATEEEEPCEEQEEAAMTEEADPVAVRLDADVSLHLGAGHTELDVEADVLEAAVVDTDKDANKDGDKEVSVKEVQAAEKPIEPLKPINPIKPIEKPIQSIVPLVKLDKPVQTAQPIRPIQPLPKIEKSAQPEKSTLVPRNVAATTRPARLWDNGFLFGSGATTDLLRDTADQLMSVIPRTFNIAPATQPLDIIMRPFFNTLASI